MLREDQIPSTFLSSGLFSGEIFNLKPVHFIDQLVILIIIGQRSAVSLIR